MQLRGMNLTIIILNERSKTKKIPYCVIQFTQNFRKYKLIYSDSLQIDGCLGVAGVVKQWERITKGFKESCGVMDTFNMLFLIMVSWVYTCQNLLNYALEIHAVYYMSIRPYKCIKILLLRSLFYFYIFRKF